MTKSSCMNYEEPGNVNLEVKIFNILKPTGNQCTAIKRHSV